MADGSTFLLGLKLSMANLQGNYGIHNFNLAAKHFFLNSHSVKQCNTWHINGNNSHLWIGIFYLEVGQSDMQLL